MAIPCFTTLLNLYRSPIACALTARRSIHEPEVACSLLSYISREMDWDAINKTVEVLQLQCLDLTVEIIDNEGGNINRKGWHVTRCNFVRTLYGAGVPYFFSRLFQKMLSASLVDYCSDEGHPQSYLTLAFESWKYDPTLESLDLIRQVMKCYAIEAQKRDFIQFLSHCWDIMIKEISVEMVSQLLKVVVTAVGSLNFAAKEDRGLPGRLLQTPMTICARGSRLFLLFRSALLRVGIDLDSFVRDEIEAQQGLPAEDQWSEDGLRKLIFLENETIRSFHTTLRWCCLEEDYSEDDLQGHRWQIYVAKLRRDCDPDKPLTEWELPEDEWRQKVSKVFEEKKLCPNCQGQSRNPFHHYHEDSEDEDWSPFQLFD